MGSTPKSDLWGGVCGIPRGLLRSGGHELSLKVSSAGDSDREGNSWEEGGHSIEAPGCCKESRRIAGVGRRGRQPSEEMKMHESPEEKEPGPGMEVWL